MSHNNYQAPIIKLEALRSSTTKSEDGRSFFSHLYRYLEFICDNSTLEANAWRLFSETYSKDHETDEYSSDLKLGNFEKHFTKVLNDYRLDSRVYYSWLYLYIFYFVNIVKPNNIAKFGKKMPNAEAPQSQLISVILQHELRSATYLLNNLDNDSVKRSDFTLYLEIFHHDFIDLLQTHTEQTNDDVKFVGNATIYYKDNMPYVTLPNETEPLKLRKLDIKPNSGYDYFLNHMFEPKNEDKLITNKDVQALHIKCEPYADIGELLRYCGFGITLKRVFMPKRRDHDAFIYQKQVPVTEKQIEDIKKAIDKIVTKS